MLLSQFLLVGALFITSCSKTDDQPSDTSSDAEPIPTPIPQRIQSKTFTVNGVSFNMMLVKAGTFAMGATPEQQNPNSDEKPIHQVKLTHHYYMGQTEVTQALWRAVMGNDPSYFKGDNLPVEQVSWDDCKEFTGRLNELTGLVFRLPTEAEWEFAARGGNNSRGYQYAGSNNLSEVAWFDDNSGSNTNPVMTKNPNELGIYDMSGNVFEWCYDCYDKYSSELQTDPSGPANASNRVFRGSSWLHVASCCRVACRSINEPVRNFELGFRLALTE